MAIFTDKQGRRFEWQLVAIASACVLFAVLAATLFRATLAGGPPQIPTDAIMGWITRVFLTLAVLMVAGTWVHHRWFFSGRQRLRRKLGGDEGYVDEYHMREAYGDQSVLREASRFWGRPQGSMTVDEASWELGELISGRWTVRSKMMRAPYPRSAVVVAPQGAGKSQYLIPQILDAQGPAVITSTKSELFDATGAWREQTCGPVYLFDPLDRAGGATNFPYDPVVGVALLDRFGRPDPGYADAIAAAMVRGAEITAKALNEQLWSDAGIEILRCYLVAADLVGGGSELVQAWAHNPADTTPIDILVAHPGRVPAGWLSLCQQRLGDPPRQRAGYFATVVSCTDYIAEPAAAEACRAARVGKFTMADFLDKRCSLYVIGDKSRRGIASMMTALTESLIYLAREHAKPRPDKHLAEPLAMFLDEVANITPIDLPTWCSEARGWGIFVFPVIQSPAQLDQVWGEYNAKIILQNLRTKIVLRGLDDDRYLEQLSRLGGERRVRRATESTHDGHEGTIGRERVIPPAIIASLPPFHAYIQGEGSDPAVVAFEPGYQRVQRLATGARRRPAWPCWWRHPLQAVVSALELGRRR